VLGAALARLGRKPFPFSLTPTVEAFFKSLAPQMPLFRAAVLGNARALGPSSSRSPRPRRRRRPCCAPRWP
jgi:hypothetical protein